MARTAPQPVTLPPLPSGRAAFRRGWRRGWTVPTPRPLDVWADTYRVLPREGASEPGRFRTARTPYMREVMACLSDSHPARRVVLMAGTQIGKTELGNCWVGSIVHQTPGPLMVVLPTQALAKRWSKQRLTPMIEATPVLREIIKPARARDSGNTTLVKEFPGGILVIAGANSAVDLRSMPVRFLFADEVDGYPDDVDGEGAPLTLAERRTSTFPRRKLFICSTPTVKDASVIEAEFLGGDQRRYHVPCPHCHHKQVLRDENLQDDGTYLCEACGRPIEHHHKTWMLEHGAWRAARPDGPYPSFHLSALYAPAGLGYTWAEIADERRKANAADSKEARQVYVNTLLGEPYEDESGKLDWQELRARAGGYRCREVPPGCVVITAGVDVQDDRFAVQFLGFGRGRHGSTTSLRVWVIDYLEIPADPAREEDWIQLDRLVLGAVFRNAWGTDLGVSAVAVDTGGHHTQDAYNYCRARKHRLVLAVKGDRYANRPIIAARPRPQDLNWRGKVLRGGVELWFVGTDTAKGWLYARLQADAHHEPHAYRIHFPADLPEDYYLQLTSERFDARAGRWRKLHGRRNEALDTAVYALAAAMHPAVRVHMLREPEWERLEARAQPPIRDLFAPGDTTAAPAAPLPGKPPAPAQLTANAPVVVRPPTRPTGRRVLSRGIGD